MKSLDTKKLLPGALMIALSLNACQQTKPKPNEAGKVGDAQLHINAQSRYPVVNNWVDDFKNFRTAVYQKDLAKMKTYFNFPVFADTTQVWEAVYENVEDSKRPKNFPHSFTEDDLEKQHDKLFNSSFVKSLLKVKSEQLYKTGEYITPEIKEGGQSYHMLAHYDKVSAMLELSVMYTGSIDENGEQVSEGESAIIYFFKVQNNKILKFDKILFAG